MKKNLLRIMKLCWPLVLALLLAGLTALADVTLPNDLTVIEAEAFLNDFSLTGTLVIPEGVTAIGDRAFEGCTGLTGQLVIPGSVTRIGSRAFANCTGLTGTVTISASVTELAEDAFVGTSLTVISGTHPDEDDSIITMTDLPEGIAFEMTDEGAVITGYTGETEARLTLPATINGVPVVAIGDGAFQDCFGLTGSIVIPSTVRRIGASAFYGCSGLDGTLTLPASVTSIGDYAFYECLSLTGSLTLPDSVESVGESAFAFCESMTGSLSLPSEIALGARCFQGSGFTGSITIPATMTLGANVFAGTQLNVTWAAPAFTYEASGSAITLTGWNGPVDSGLTIPAQLNGVPVTAIADAAFADIGLTGDVILPGSVTVIGDSAFRSNPGITSVTFASGLTTVSAYAFADCSGLSGTVTLPSTVVALDDTAFDGCSVQVVIAPAP
ncbi:MAG: leucine-rich repeat protein [Aristaeellaceae bacterium]